MTFLASIFPTYSILLLSLAAALSARRWPLVNIHIWVSHPPYRRLLPLLISHLLLGIILQLLNRNSSIQMTMFEFHGGLFVLSLPNITMHVTIILSTF